MTDNKASGFMTHFMLEIKKTRYRKIWLILIAVGALQYLWSFWLLSKANSKELAEGYYKLLFQMPFLNAIIFPLLIAMIASRICDIEMKGNTLKLLYTLQKKGRLFDCKLLLEISYIIGILIFQMILIYIQGQNFHFNIEIPMKLMICYFLSTFIVSITILLLQQTLSLLFENQIVPLTVGLIGSFLGLFSMFFPKIIQRYILWGYYSVFSTIGSSWNKKTGELHLYEVPFHTDLFIMFVIFGLIIYITGKSLFLRKEV